MNEEEKKAVELLEDIRNNSWTTKYIMSSDSKNAGVLLNLIEKLQKENEEYSKQLDLDYVDKNYIPIPKVKDKIEEIQKEYSKLDQQVDEYIKDVNKDLSKYYESKEKIAIMQTLACFVGELQELIEESEEN